MPPPPTSIELRQYTLHAGQRETLIALFEREFVAPQRACGMQLLGRYRDLDRPERFVWLRGFVDMAARPAALAAFYDGPVWRAHRDAANATMVDSDDVLLLRPALPGDGFEVAAHEHVLATICPLQMPADAALLQLFAQAVAPGLRAAGARVLAVLASEPQPNNWPRLPVREGPPVLAWFTALADPALDAAPALPDALKRQLAAPPERLRLAPVSRSF